MSSFDEWYDQATFQGEALFLFVDRRVAKCLCNAGMERAAEILDELYNTYATNEAKDIAELQAQAIRKEIEK